MKKTVVTILAFLSISMASAQDWKVNFEESKEQALEENKPIIMVFQGSDWCVPCMKLEKSIWSTNEFKNYAEDNYVMLQVDFPRRKKNALSAEQQEQNNKLAETYNKNGFFPFVVVLDAKGNVLGKTGYKKATPAAYIKEIDSFL